MPDEPKDAETTEEAAEGAEEQPQAPEAPPPPPPPAAAPPSPPPAQPTPGPTATSQEERTWAMICHVSAIAGFVFPLGNLFGPLIVWLIQKDKLPLVNDQGKESLNFQISMTVYLVVAGLFSLVLIGIPFLIALIIADIVLIIIAAIKASEGTAYRYPLTFRLIQ